MEKLSAEELAAIEALVSEPETVSAGELGEWLGLTPNRVSALGRDGIIPRTDDKRFPLRSAIRAYCEHARAGATGRRADSELAAEKLRAAKATADKLELANAKARGDLLDGKQVANEWRSIITDLRAAVLAVPSRVASRMGMDRATTVALDTEIRDAMEGIANDR